MHGCSGSSAFNLDRRQFIRLSLIAGATMAGGAPWLEAASGESLSPAHAALNALAPGAVRSQGWLRVMLAKQAAQLGSQLPNVSWPFTGAYWAGEEIVETVNNDDAWWPWEQKGYWLDGATRLALVLGDEQLLAHTRHSIDYTLAHAAPNGYLGPQMFREPKGDFHRWPQNVMFRSLLALGDAQNPPGPAEAADLAGILRAHYLGDDADYGKPTRNVTNIEAMLWAYGHTGDRRLLDLAENAWKEYLTVADDGHGDLSPLRVFAATPINAHGCTYAETMKLPAILYLHTGKPEYLEFAVAANRRIFDHHMLVDGIPSTSEWYRTVTSLDSHETCDIADHTWSWGYMLMATGDAAWADRIERACFNAAPGAIRNDWKSLQYFSCPNQFLATINSDHNLMEHGGRKMAFQPNPGQATACCGGNVHRIMPNYAIRMWMKSNDGGLAAVLYGPSRIKTTIGSSAQPVEIVQTTHYPFEEQIHFRIETSAPIAFPLLLRIPAWCDKPSISINGKSVAAERNTKGFAVIRRTFKSGDEIVLALPMRLALTHWPQGGVALEHGPIVYAFPIPAHWTSHVEPRFDTADFPTWEATPAGPWNYGLAVDPANLLAEVQFTRMPIAAGDDFDPWSEPPAKLTVPVRRIEGWDLQPNPGNPAQKFTPPLPVLGDHKISENLERITLVPYGATELRMTIFPSLPG